MHRLLQRRRERGTLAPADRKPPAQRSIKDDDRTRLREFIRRRPDATLAQTIDALGLTVHPSTSSRTLTGTGLPRKKSKHAAEQDRLDVQAARGEPAVCKGPHGIRLL